MATTTLAAFCSILLPALLAARECARRQTSADHLRQIGEALLSHADTFGFFPTNGGPSAEAVSTPEARTYNPSESSPYEWGYGDPRRAGRLQPGSWAYAVLPFLGEQQAFAERDQAVAVPSYYIPGRRPAQAEVALEESDPVYPGWLCLPDGVNPWGKTDYAANDQVIRGGVGNVMRPDAIRGLATTILVGEKAMDSRAAGQGGWYWDEPIILGGSGGTGRKGNRLVPDGPIHEQAADNWGSPRPEGVVFALADGSVRTVSYQTDPDVMTALIQPRDDETLPDPWWTPESLRPRSEPDHPR